MTSVEQHVGANQEALTRIEEKLDKMVVAPAPVVPATAAPADTDAPDNPVPDQGAKHPAALLPAEVGAPADDPIIAHKVMEIRNQLNGL